MPFKKQKDYNSYMREYMRSYRKKERELIRWARKNRAFMPTLPFKAGKLKEKK